MSTIPPIPTIFDSRVLPNGHHVRRLVGSTCLISALFAGVLVLPADSANAQYIRTWINPTKSGSFDNAANWDPYGVPTSDDAADFTLDQTYTVTFPYEENPGDLAVNKGQVTFDLNSQKLLIPGTLTVRNAANPTSLGIKDGTVTVGDLVVRDGGTLALFKENFSLATVLNVNGDIDVDGGSLSPSIDVFTLAPGSDVTIQNGGYLGPFVDTHIQQGRTYHVLSGGDLSTSALQIAGDGLNGDGTLLVDGAGSMARSNNYGSLFWGLYDNATVEVTNGGLIKLNSHTLGLANSNYGSQSTATVTIAGANSKFVFTDASNEIGVGHSSGGSAVIHVTDGGLFSHLGGVGGSAVRLYPTGEIHVNNGGIFETTRLIDNGGLLDFAGGTLRFQDYQGNLVNSAGTVQLIGIGPAPGSTQATVTGNYNQHAAGTLDINIGGLDPGEADSLLVHQNAILHGTLDVELANNFEPAIGNEFTILETDVGNVGSTFDALNFPIFDGMTFHVVYNPNSVVLEVIPATGDFDHDGDVDGNDFLVWQRGGSPNGISSGDLALWQGHYGSRAGSSPTPINAVPEPTTLVLLSLGLLLFPGTRIARIGYKYRLS